MKNTVISIYLCNRLIKAVMITLLITFIVITTQHAFRTQQIDENVDCNGNDCQEITSCISKYTELERFIMSDDEVKDNMTEAYFKTDGGTTDFVKITYRFQILKELDSNDTSESNCSARQRQFIWSQSALNLLGPRPLYWLTLFAVNVPDASVTIQLPCLCFGFADKLLSRLTYLVSCFVYTSIALYICIGFMSM